MGSEAFTAKLNRDHELKELKETALRRDLTFTQEEFDEIARRSKNDHTQIRKHMERRKTMLRRKGLLKDLKPDAHDDDYYDDDTEDDASSTKIRRGGIDFDGM